MANVFSQKTTYIEDGYGEVSFEIVIADEHAALLTATAEKIATDGPALAYVSGFTVNGLTVVSITQDAAGGAFIIYTHGLSNGDIVQVLGNSGDTEWNDLFQNLWFEVVEAVTADTFKLQTIIAEVNIFDLESVEEAIEQGKLGGIIKPNMKFNINESILTNNLSYAARDFVLQGIEVDVNRYCAVFINPSSPVRSPGEAKFIGQLLQEFEDNDLEWGGSQFGTDVDALKRWQFQAGLEFNDFFASITTNELINGDEESPQIVEGISTAFEIQNVADRQGWYYKVYGASILQTKINDLVNLNHVLRELADILIKALSNKGFGDFKITYDRNELDGKYFPARWTHQIETRDGTTRYPRYITWNGSPEDIPFRVFDNEGQTLVIDPDGLVPKFTGSGLDDLETYGDLENSTQYDFKIEIDGTGTPDTFRWSIDNGLTWEVQNVSITGAEQDLIDGISIKFAATTGHTLTDYWLFKPATNYESIWINYNVVKLWNLEFYKEEANNFLWSNEKVAKDFVELITSLAGSVGTTMRFTYTDTNTMNISFIPQKEFNKTQVYIKDTTNSKRKITPVLLTDEPSFIAFANYLGISGQDQYHKFSNDSEAKDIQYGKSPAIKGKSYNVENKLLLTISPTIANMGDDAYDPAHGVWCSYGDIPVNHYFALNDTISKYWYNSARIQHTAIYMYVDKVDRTGSGIPNESLYYDFEPDSYWTLAAQLAVEIDGEDKYFTRLVDFVNLGKDRTVGYIKSEQNLTIPYINNYSQNSDGSSPNWTALQLGAIFNLSSFVNSIIKLKINFRKINVDLTANGSTRFNDIGDIASPSLITPGIIEPVEITGFGNIVNIAANTAVKVWQFMTLIPATAIAAEKVQPINSNNGENEFGRSFGFCKRDQVIDELLMVQKSGVIITDDWIDLLGSEPEENDILYLQELDPVTGVNITLICPEYKKGFLYCEIGRFVTSEQLVLTPGFTEQFVFE